MNIEKGKKRSMGKREKIRRKISKQKLKKEKKISRRARIRGKKGFRTSKTEKSFFKGKLKTRKAKKKLTVCLHIHTYINGGTEIRFKIFFYKIGIWPRATSMYMKK